MLQTSLLLMKSLNKTKTPVVDKSGGSGPPLDRAPKGLPRSQTIGNSVCTSRRLGCHKQLAILYVRRDATTYTNNWQFCMYVETTSSGVLPRFLRPERRGPQVSIVRASAPGDGPRPRRPRGRYTPPRDQLIAKRTPI